MLAAGCVVPPPLEVDTSDAGVNAPPAITNVTDPSFNPHRPPDTLSIDNSGRGEIGVTMVDIDLQDTLYVQLFVDYDSADPTPAVVQCAAPPGVGPSVIRTTACTTAGLCPSELGSHTLEIEVYDRPPGPNTPYRIPEEPGYYATWTFHLECTAAP